jgi:hypothetical protein
MKKLWLVAAMALFLGACASADKTAPATADDDEVAADPGAVTVTTSGRVQVGVRSSIR